MSNASYHHDTKQGVQSGSKEAIAARFSRATPLDRERHQSIQLNRNIGFGFSRMETAVPLIVTEFSAAARDLPIVFAGDDQMPLAVLGIRSQQNLLVDENGKWKAGCYIPAHLRRYPFILQEDEAKQQFALCIDESAEHFHEGKDIVGEALFVAEQPTPLVTDMLNFLRDIQQGFKITQAYVAAVREENLLIERNAVIKLNTGEQAQLDGFYIIDEAKFNELSDETFKAWRAKGWLALTYFHLQSQLNWQRLVDCAVQAST